MAPTVPILPLGISAAIPTLPSICRRDGTPGAIRPSAAVDLDAFLDRGQAPLLAARLTPRRERLFNAPATAFSFVGRKRTIIRKRRSGGHHARERGSAPGVLPGRSVRRHRP